jgi:hypothetical protein
MSFLYRFPAKLGLLFLFLFAGCTCGLWGQIGKGSLLLDDPYGFELKSSRGEDAVFGLELSPTATWFWSSRWGVGGSFGIVLDDPSLAVHQEVRIRHNAYQDGALCLFGQLGWRRLEVFQDQNKRFVRLILRQEWLGSLGIDYFLSPNFSFFVSYSNSLYQRLIQGRQATVRTGGGYLNLGYRAFFHRGEYSSLQKKGLISVQPNWRRGRFTFGGDLSLTNGETFGPVSPNGMTLSATPGYFLLSRLVLLLHPGLEYTIDFRRVNFRMGSSFRYHLPLSRREYLYSGLGFSGQLEIERLNAANERSTTLWSGLAEAGLGVFSRPDLTLEVGLRFFPEFRSGEWLGFRTVFSVGFRYFAGKR